MHVVPRNHFADTNIDIRYDVNPDFVCDITKKLPFRKNQFAAAFADTPWISSWRWDFGQAMRELLRVAPIVYTINPWLYGAKTCTPENIMVSQRPGINTPILFVKYVRNEDKFWKQYKIESRMKIMEKKK